MKITIEYGDETLGTVTMEEYPTRGLRSVLLDQLEDYDIGWYIVTARDANNNTVGKSAFEFTEDGNNEIFITGYDMNIYMQPTPLCKEIERLRKE